VTFVFGNNFITEILFKIFADYKYKFAKSGIDSIID
jgi:hypothetical protein